MSLICQAVDVYNQSRIFFHLEKKLFLIFFSWNESIEFMVWAQHPMLPILISHSLNNFTCIHEVSSKITCLWIRFEKFIGEVKTLKKYKGVFCDKVFNLHGFTRLSENIDLNSFSGSSIPSWARACYTCALGFSRYVTPRFSIKYDN